MASVVSGIDHVVMAHEESDLAGMIREFSANSVLLMAIVPSADMQAISSDDYEEIDSCFVFLVRKLDMGSITHTEYLSVLESLQGKISQIKHLLIDWSADTEHLTPYSHMLHNLNINSMHTDPEYNLLGCYGYGLSFQLKTKGVNNQF